MTDEERLSLQRDTVSSITATARRMSPDARARQRAGGRRGAQFQTERRVAQGRLAARYAHLHGVTLTEAARAFDVSRTTVSAAWDEMYPSEPTPLAKSEAP